MSRRKITKEEAAYYWKLIKKGCSHLEAWEICERVFYKKRLTDLDKK